MRFRLNPIVFFLLCIFILSAYAEDGIPVPRQDSTLVNLPGNSDEAPVFISAQQMGGKNGYQVEATGEVELRKRG